MPKPIATWNPTRGIWENPNGAVSLFSEHSEPFSAIWPISGMTRNGRAFELPTQEPRTDASESSSSPDLPEEIPLLGTPRNADGSKAPLVQRERPRSRLEDQIALLKTPTTQLAVNGGSQHPEKRKEGGHGPTLADEIEHLLPSETSTASPPTPSGPPSAAEPSLLPTPSVADGMGGHVTRGGNRSTELLLPGIAQALTAASTPPEEALLPTPNAWASNDGEGPTTWLARRERHKARGINGNGMGTPLAIAVQLLPTPTAMDSEASGGSNPANRTLTDATVRESLGAATNPRFADGKP